MPTKTKTSKSTPENWTKEFEKIWKEINKRTHANFPSPEDLRTRFIMDDVKARETLVDLSGDMKVVKANIKNLDEKIDDNTNRLDRRIDKVETSIRTWGLWIIGTIIAAWATSMGLVVTLFLNVQ